MKETEDIYFEHCGLDPRGSKLSGYGEVELEEKTRLIHVDHLKGSVRMTV